MPGKPNDRSGSGTPDILPRPDFHFTGEVGRTYLDSDAAQFPQPVKAPAGAPNILLILLDDVGFGQFSTFGGGVPSPTMDRLAKEGKKVAEGRLERTVPVQFSIGEGLDIGMDGGSPVDFTYQLPFAFTGTIEKVTIELKAKASDLKEPEPAVKRKAVGVAHP
jgi:hypothetical protein